MSSCCHIPLHLRQALPSSPQKFLPGWTRKDITRKNCQRHNGPRVLSLSLSDITHCISCKFSHQVAPLALPHCLGLPYWHYQQVLSWYLYLLESHQLSLNKVFQSQNQVYLGPIFTDQNVLPCLRFEWCVKLWGEMSNRPNFLKKILPKFVSIYVNL